MADDDKKRSPIVNAILGLIGAIVLIPLVGAFMMFVAFGLGPILDHGLNQRDFEPQAWAVNEDNVRYYMTSDVEDFLDDHPTREQVVDKLGAPDFTYICSGECWELGTPTGFSEHFLDVSFDASGRVASHAVRSH